MTDSNNPTQGQAPQEDNLTDHSYDGIQEYDNPLPGWWVAIFWGSIVWSFFYFGWYTAGPGDSWLDTFNQEVEALAEQKDAAAKEQLSSLGEVSGSAASLMRMAANADLMESQKALWAVRCAVCHTADGRGMVGLGPNMKDDHYLNVKTIEDIPKIVTEGIPGKAMTPFKGLLTEQEILTISAYVASMRGSALDPSITMPVKEAEGEVIPPWSAE
ncbi:MAG: c-type cytochrome [Planctomycetes bacterium]|nr:c-type cytochrome [Planctomycetota bacterium]